MDNFILRWSTTLMVAARSNSTIFALYKMCYIHFLLCIWLSMVIVYGYYVLLSMSSISTIIQYIWLYMVIIYGYYVLLCILLSMSSISTIIQYIWLYMVIMYCYVYCYVYV
jgi:hypothetical protein